MPTSIAELEWVRKQGVKSIITMTENPLPESWIKDINWGDAKISVDMTQQQVKDAPLFDPKVPFSRQQELGIHIHYGRTGYWEDYTKMKDHISS